MTPRARDRGVRFKFRRKGGAPTGRVRNHALPPSPLDWCPASIPASRARSAGERVNRAATSFASGSPWSAADDPRAAPPWSIPSPSPGPPSDRPAFTFSPSLVQTLVQTAKGVAASPLPAPSADGDPLLDKLEVTGSSPVTPTPKRPLSTMDSGRNCLLGKSFSAGSSRVCRRVVYRPETFFGLWGWLAA